MVLKAVDTLPALPATFKATPKWVVIGSNPLTHPIYAAYFMQMVRLIMGRQFT